MARLIVFTDLDGTLLDAHTSSAEPALGTMEELKRRGIPLVFCTSKTRSEVLALRAALGNVDAFIVENGGGIFAPASRFRISLEERGFEPAGDDLLGLRLGMPYDSLRAALVGLRSQGFGVRGFGDMSDAEVAELVGLPLDAARLARQREFDEPFVLLPGEKREDEIVEQELISGIA